MLSLFLVKLSWALLLCLPALAGAAPFTAFRDGETFTYRVGFAIFGHAGDLIIAAHDQKVDGTDVMSVTTDTKSRGIVRGFYAFDNKAEVVINKATGQILREKESGALGAAMFAAIGTGWFSTYEEAIDGWVKVDHIIEPDRKLGKILRSRFGIYKDLYPALKETIRTGRISS